MILSKKVCVQYLSYLLEFVYNYLSVSHKDCVRLVCVRLIFSE